MNDELLDALYAIPPGDLDYSEWLQIGMALKYEGYDWRDWDNWSKQDRDRYEEGVCEEKWWTFCD